MENAGKRRRPLSQTIGPLLFQQTALLATPLRYKPVIKVRGWLLNKLGYGGFARGRTVPETRSTPLFEKSSAKAASEKVKVEGVMHAVVPHTTPLAGLWKSRSRFMTVSGRFWSFQVFPDGLTPESRRFVRQSGYCGQATGSDPGGGRTAAPRAPHPHLVLSRRREMCQSSQGIAGSPEAW